MTTLRVAVVGAGHLGRIHARLLRTIEGCELVAVVDPVEASRTAAAQEFGTRGLAGHEELPGLVDAVVVAAPTQHHHAIALDLLARGVHLLVEKPLAATHRECHELVDAARRQRRVLQVGHVERFNPAWSAALPHVRDPKFIECVRAGGFAFRSTDIGVVLDLMIHDLDLVLSVVPSPVRSVEALGMAMFGRHEDLAHARLVFENGCVANLSASRASATPTRGMRLWSQRSLATIDFASRTTTVVRPSETLLRREFDVEQLSPAERTHWKERLLAEHLPVETIQAPPQDAITAELRDFVESIRTGRAPRVAGEQGRDAVRVAEQILASIEHHEWNGTEAGPVGPLAMPSPRVIPAPHWTTRPAGVPKERREAG